MRRVALLVLFFVAACGSFGAAQPHTLSLAYKAGDTYKYKFHSTSKQTAGTGGMTIPVSVDTSANETVAVLPDKAVKVGDTWSKTYDQKDPIGSGTVHIVSDSKYLRDESFNGVTAAVVETKSTSTLDLSGPTQGTPGAMSGVSVKGTFTTDVMTWIDPNGHRVLKSHSTAQDDLTINLPTTSTN